MQVDSLPQSAIDLAIVFVRQIEPQFIDMKTRVGILGKLALRLTGREPPLSADELIEILSEMPEPPGAEVATALAQGIETAWKVRCWRYVKLNAGARRRDMYAIRLWWQQLDTPRRSH